MNACVRNKRKDAGGSEPVAAVGGGREPEGGAVEASAPSGTGGGCGGSRKRPGNPASVRLIRQLQDLTAVAAVTGVDFALAAPGSEASRIPIQDSPTQGSRKGLSLPSY